MEGKTTGSQEVKKWRVLNVRKIVQWILESLRIMAGIVRKEELRHTLDPKSENSRGVSLKVCG